MLERTFKTKLDQAAELRIPKQEIKDEVSAPTGRSPRRAAAKPVAGHVVRRAGAPKKIDWFLVFLVLLFLVGVGLIGVFTYIVFTPGPVPVTP